MCLSAFVAVTAMEHFDEHCDKQIIFCHFKKYLVNHLSNIDLQMSHPDGFHFICIR